jgi:hypothetical protein
MRAWLQQGNEAAPHHGFPRHAFTALPAGFFIGTEVHK